MANSSPERLAACFLMTESLTQLLMRSPNSHPVEQTTEQALQGLYTLPRSSDGLGTA